MSITWLINWKLNNDGPFPHAQCPLENKIKNEKNKLSQTQHFSLLPFCQIIRCTHHRTRPTHGTSIFHPIPATRSNRWTECSICSAIQNAPTIWIIRTWKWTILCRTCKRCARWLPMGHCEFKIRNIRIEIGINSKNRSRWQKVVLLSSAELSVLEIPIARAAQWTQRAGFTEGCTTQGFL